MFSKKEIADQLNAGVRDATARVITAGTIDVTVQAMLHDIGIVMRRYAVDGPFKIAMEDFVERWR